MTLDEPRRPDPDALLARSGEGGARPAEGVPRHGAGGGQDLRDAGAGRAAQSRGPRRGGRRGRDPWPPRDRGADRRPGDPAAQADRLPRPHADGVRHRRGAGAQARAAAGRRVRPLQRPRLAPPEALAGRRGAARPPASTSGPRSTSSTWRAWSTWSGRSPACASARRCRTRCSPRPTRSRSSTSPRPSCASAWPRARSMCRRRRGWPRENFFKPENLTALRELALRRAAQAVDDELIGAMRRAGVSGPWAAGRADPGAGRRRLHGRPSGAHRPAAGRDDGRALDGRPRRAPRPRRRRQRSRWPRVNEAMKLAEQLGGVTLSLDRRRHRHRGRRLLRQATTSPSW